MLRTFNRDSGCIEAFILIIKLYNYINHNSSPATLRLIRGFLFFFIIFFFLFLLFFIQIRFTWGTIVIWLAVISFEVSKFISAILRYSKACTWSPVELIDHALLLIHHHVATGYSWINQANLSDAVLIYLFRFLQ